MRSVSRKNFRNKAEPLLLLFPGCCNDTASVMRIRKGQARGSNARGESYSSDAFAATGSQQQIDKTDAEFLHVGERIHQAAEKCETIAERDVVVTSEAPPTWLANLQTAKRSPTPQERPYMNLDEFVHSLASKNCFSDEEFINPYSDHQHTTGESSRALIKNFSGQSDEFIPHFPTVDSGSSIKNVDVDTSLRLAPSSPEKSPVPPPQPLKPAVDRAKKKVNIVDTGEIVYTLDDGRRGYCTTDREAIIGTLGADQNIIAHVSAPPGQIEACGQSYHMTHRTSILEPTEAEIEAGQPNQTMKSSTESTERRSSRPRRASSSTGKKRGRLPSPGATNEEQTEDIHQEEEASSDYSSQRAKSRRAKRKRTLVSVSSSTLATHASEKRKPKLGLNGSGEGESASKRIKSKKERKTGNSRSGRPKRLKYLKQENKEELGNQCNRSDGKGWTCPLLAKTGYQLCDHHLDKLRCKPGSRSKYNKKKKAAATLS